MSGKEVRQFEYVPTIRNDNQVEDDHDIQNDNQLQDNNDMQVIEEEVPIEDLLNGEDYEDEQNLVKLVTIEEIFNMDHENEAYPIIDHHEILKGLDCMMDEIIDDSQDRQEDPPKRLFNWEEDMDASQDDSDYSYNYLEILV